MPEIRSATRNADLLLAELESLRLLGLDLYRSIRDQLRQALESKKISMQDLYWSMELYCHTLQSLLASEEEELFAVALNAIPSEKWFLIAEKFMQQDKEALEFGQVGHVAPSRSDLLIPSSRLPIPEVQSPPSGLSDPDSHASSSLHDDAKQHPFRHSAGRLEKIVAHGAY